MQGSNKAENHAPVNFEKERILFFQMETDDDLIESYNLEIGASGWGHARLFHLSGMKSEMIRRGWDISAITGDDGGFKLTPESYCKLKGKRIVLLGFEKKDVPAYSKEADDTIESMVENFAVKNPYYWNLAFNAWRYRMFKKLDLLDIFLTIALKENNTELLNRIYEVKQIVKDNYRYVIGNKNKHN